MSTAKKPKILIVEDDIALAVLLGEDLSERGFQVKIAYSGHEGLTSIEAERPDLILCDIMMPTISGLDILSQVNRSRAPDSKAVPFIFITALAERENELSARRLGAADYIVKPIDFDILAEIINARLNCARCGPKPAEIVKLSGREAEVLTWSARGKTSLEIAELLQLTKRTIDSHVDSARRKLKVETRVEAAVKAVIAGLIKPYP